MRYRGFIVLIVSLLFGSSAFAQTDLAGTWQGKLTVDQNTKMIIQFVLDRKADGSYSAILNSPDTGAIKNVAASAVRYSGGKLNIDVAGLSGSYSGTVGKGIITGEWKQQGTSIPLILTPYKKPEAGAFKTLLGRWEGKLSPPGAGELTIVFRFEIAKDGSFSGFLDVPEQGAKGVPVSDVALEGSQISFKIPSAQIDYSGKLSGNGIDGTFKQGGAQFELDLTKGHYQAPPINLPVEAVSALMGKWAGKLDIPGDVLHNFILRFEKSRDGKFYGYLDCPERGTIGSRLADVVLRGDQFSCRVPATNAKYSGKLSNNSIAGIYEAAGKQHNLIVVKGAKVEPQIAHVDIPPDVMKQLLGRWTCKLGGLTVTFRFEQSPGGKNAIFVDIPEQNINGLQVLKASLIDGKIWMKMSGSEYGGKLNGNKIDGGLKLMDQGGNAIPLPLTKG